MGDFVKWALVTFLALQAISIGIMVEVNKKKYINLVSTIVPTLFIVGIIVYWE